ncbi:hypothetical protein MML48_1g14949 [Holotrichia oblita]|uniref:Uncharacterized protein n=1 Tax=Holotrichia oblita TaxID=644536 RepID=A0ACB9TTD5_HOLOL|nr:hypothetical protein MML48_1g14949 [Holotrichia oblita]
MSEEAIQPGEHVERFINKLICENDIKNVIEIKYQSGAQAGDGYASRQIAVAIITDDDVFNFFVKSILKVIPNDTVPIDKLFSTEINFYNVVYPAYRKFLNEKEATHVFHHVPKCYGTSKEDGVIVLENLKHRGFTLYDRTVPMGRVHLELVLKTFAKFHAVSFAFKDQDRNTYRQLVDNSHGDVLSKIMSAEVSVQMIKIIVKDFLAQLDPVQDKKILDQCEDLIGKLLESVSSPKQYVNEYSILTQADCWCNNVMFSYTNETPTDVVLIDWQLLREASPVFDFSFFVYTIASAEVLDNLSYYLDFYYKHLSDTIRELGSDPDVMYPKDVFEREWKQHGKYGFGMAFISVRMMLAAKDEVMKMEEINLANTHDVSKMYLKFKKQKEFTARMKLLAEHVIKNNLL